MPRVNDTVLKLQQRSCTDDIVFSGYLLAQALTTRGLVLRSKAGINSVVNMYVPAHVHTT